jgi:hypothetical protein
LFVPRAAIITDPYQFAATFSFAMGARVAVVQLGATRDNTVQILSGFPAPSLRPAIAATCSMAWSMSGPTPGRNEGR